MENVLFAIGTFIVLFLWLIVIYVIWSSRNKKPLAKQPGILGYVDEIVQTDDGLEVHGTFTEEGKKLADQNKLTGMSMRIKPVTVTETEDGSRLIKTARIMNASLVPEANALGGKIDYVGTQPETGDPGQGVKPGKYED